VRRAGQELTPREREIAVLLGLGYRVRAIARELESSPRTIDTHIRNAARKLPGHAPPCRKLTIWAKEREIEELNRIYGLPNLLAHR
jgi:DNA-binding NarL/FixJ family response regulator